MAAGCASAAASALWGVRVVVAGTAVVRYSARKLRLSTAAREHLREVVEEAVIEPLEEGAKTQQVMSLNPQTCELCREIVVALREAVR